MTDPLLAYAFRSDKPPDLAGFRRLAELGGPLGDVTAVCFLVGRHPLPDGSQASVRALLFEVMPRLLPQLNRTTRPERVVQYGRADGRIDWSTTYKARYAEEGNPAIYVCQQSWRRYNQPENQLLRFVLARIENCLDRIPPRLRAWSAWSPGPNPGREKETRVEVGIELAAFAHAVRRYRASVYLRDVSLPAVIGGEHVMAARTAKNGLYAHVAALYTVYTQIVEAPDWERWTLALNRVAPLPTQLGQLERLLLSTT